jgi:hypothetical protein
MLVARSVFRRVGVLAVVPGVGVANVRHDGHLPGEDLPKDRLELRRIQSQAAHDHRARRNVELYDPAAEVVKRLQPDEPVIHPVRRDLAPLRHRDEMEPRPERAAAPVAMQAHALLELAHGDEAVDAVVLGGFEPVFRVAVGQQVAVEIDDQPVHLRPGHRPAEVEPVAVVIGRACRRCG